MILALIALAASASAAPGAGYYHPDEVASASKRFAEAADAVGPAYSQAESALSRLGKGLEELELGVAMLGAQAPAPLRDWAAESRKTAAGQLLQVQRHVDLLQEDYGRVFLSALEGALPKVAAGRTLTECGGRSSGLPGLSRPKSCAGEDMNGALAAALDADPGLAKELASIAAVPWPEVGISPQQQAPVALTGTQRFVHAGPLIKAFASEAVSRRREVLDDALAPFEDGLDAGEAEAVAQARAPRAAYEAGLGKDGTLLLGALTPALERGEKKGGPAAVGLCVNPPILGGCAGEDVTDELVEALQADRRFLKEVQALTSP